MNWTAQKSWIEKVKKSYNHRKLAKNYLQHIQYEMGLLAWVGEKCTQYNAVDENTYNWAICKRWAMRGRFPQHIANFVVVSWQRLVHCLLIILPAVSKLLYCSSVMRSWLNDPILRLEEIEAPLIRNLVRWKFPNGWKTMRLRLWQREKDLKKFTF